MTNLRLNMFQSGTLKCKLHNIKMNQGLTLLSNPMKISFETSKAMGSALSHASEAAPEKY
jgi:hypothetical protein